MKRAAAFKTPSKILMALAVLFFAGVSFQASAGDIAQEDPAAPCGVLEQVGTDKFIYNNSNFLFKVRFETQSFHPMGKRKRSVNAGAVKYLELKDDGHGVWRDTGVGNYHSTKSYSIPVAPNKMVRIAYCGDTSGYTAYIKGSVYFDKAESDGEHNGPQGDVGFSGEHLLGSRDVNTISFDGDGSTTPFVYYNAQPSGNDAPGSLTICPKDINCTLE